MAHKFSGKYVYVTTLTKDSAMDYLNKHNISFYYSTGRLVGRTRSGMNKYKFKAE